MNNALTLPVLSVSNKSLPAAPVWSAPDTDGLMQFVAPLSIESLTISGLLLRGHAYESHIERAILFQIEVASPGIRTRIPLARIEWRPLNEPHKNPPSNDPVHSRRLIFGSHFHPFELNWVSQNEAMRTGNLPFAIPLSPDPQNFSELLDISGNLFRINNIGLVECPAWMGRLL